jgi:hypothetical protein
MFIDDLVSIKFLVKIYSSQDTLFVFGMTVPGVPGPPHS